MAKIMFVWELGGGMGHCALMRPLIDGLIQRGHSLFLASCDLAIARSMCQPLDIHYLPVPNHVVPAPQIRVPRTFAHLLQNTCFGDQAEMEAIASSWRTLLSLVKPDLIVCEHAPSALLATRGSTVRRVVMGTGFTVPPNLSPWPDLRPWLEAADADLALNETSMLHRTNEVLRTLGLAPLGRMAELYADVDAQILVTYPELDHYGNREDTEYVGTWSQSGGILPEWPDGEGKRIFAYVKSYDPLWRAETLLSVLRERQYPTLVYVGGAKSSRWAPFQTSHLRIVPDRVDIGRLATTADVAILNGTAVTTAELLRTGVPLLQIPVSLEQTILSRRVAEMGAGVIADPQRPELLAIRIDELLHNSSLKEATTTFAARCAELDSLQQASRVTEKLDELARA